MLPGACSASAPNRLLVPISVMVTGAISPISARGAIDLHRLQIWRAADDLARHGGPAFRTARRRCGRRQRALKARLLRGRSAPAGAAGARLSRPPATWSAMSAAGRAGPRRIFEREGAGEADLVDQARACRAKSSSVSPGKPTMKSDESARSGRARAQALDDVADNPRACGGGSSPRGCGRSRTAPADAGSGISAGRSRCAAIRSSSMSRGWLVV